jgi:hypothetical protein
MTTFASTTITCGACGHNFAHDDLSSTNRFGSMDLDLRPPEMERSTMQAWLQQCPNCGYSAVDASTFDPRHRAVLESPEYRQHLTNSGLPPLAAKFICAGLLAEAAGQLEEAGLSYLRSAWVMDDVMAPVDGRKWRNRACDCLKRAVAAPDISSDARTSLSTILVDCLRRAGRGEEALQLINRILPVSTHPVINQVLGFQRELVARGDESAHTIGEIQSKKD